MKFVKVFLFLGFLILLSACLVDMEPEENREPVLIFDDKIEEEEENKNEEDKREECRHDKECFASFGEGYVCSYGECVFEEEKREDNSGTKKDDTKQEEDEIEEDVQEFIRNVALSYNLPEWFLLALVHRESSFNASLINLEDGIEGEENWNHKNSSCAFTLDGYPHGLGLTQLTGWMYQGSPYPFCLEEPNNDLEEWYYTMNKKLYGDWINMEEVSVLEDPFDPEQNLDRFLSGYAIPAYNLFQELYKEKEETTLRRVAYHWNKGLYEEYDPNNEDYLGLYDQYVEEYKDESQQVVVAFIGDQGAGEGAIAVLNLIYDEGADMVLHQGDFDYQDNPDLWDQQISDVLGESFPYFASIGNHDVDQWDEYQEKLQSRLDKVEGAACSGDLGVNSFCTYKGIDFVLSGVGTKGEDHAQYIDETFLESDAIWKICSWHKNQRLMQVGGKEDETGWDVYDTCRKHGAIIATGHEHSYSRTYLLSSFETQEVASFSETLYLEEGKSFAFVSGLGGKSVREQNDELAANNWWAAVYTATQDATHGALFCVFNPYGDENRAQCYFKDIDGRVVDEFDLVSNLQ